MVCHIMTRIDRKVISASILLMLVIPLAVQPMVYAENLQVDVHVYFNRAAERYHNLLIYYKDPYFKFKQYLIHNFSEGYSKEGSLVKCMTVYYANKGMDKFNSWLKQLGVEGLYTANFYSSSLLVISLLNESLEHDTDLIKTRKADIAEAYLHLLGQYCNDPSLTETDKTDIVVEVLPIKRVTFKEIDRFDSIVVRRLGRLLHNGGFTVGRAAEWFDVMLSERWIKEKNVTLEEAFDQIRMAAREAFGRDVPVPVIVVTGDVFRVLLTTSHNEQLKPPEWVALVLTILIGAASAISLAMLRAFKNHRKSKGN